MSTRHDLARFLGIWGKRLSLFTIGNNVYNGRVYKDVYNHVIALPDATTNNSIKNLHLTTQTYPNPITSTFLALDK
jgi:hypothetical protein